MAVRWKYISRWINLEIKISNFMSWIARMSPISFCCFSEKQDFWIVLVRIQYIIVSVKLVEAENLDWRLIYQEASVQIFSLDESRWDYDTSLNQLLHWRQVLQTNIMICKLLFSLGIWFIIKVSSSVQFMPNLDKIICIIFNNWIWCNSSQSLVF